MHLGLLFALCGQVAPADVVDARGSHDVVFTAPGSGMYRVRVQSEAGTACTIADHLRGPFASSGTVGVKSCDLDVLLDAGLYKARLESPAQGKGRAQLQATPFTMVASAVRLDEGRSLELVVRPREQAAAWMRIDKRQNVSLQIAGRTVGKVGIWRDGKWLEDQSINHSDVMPRPGNGMHRWQMDATLEPGDYQLLVYGTDAKAWTNGVEQDVVFISRGAVPGSSARSQTFTIPAWGFTQLAIPHDAAAAFLQLDVVAAEPVTLTAAQVRMDATLGPVRTGNTQRCAVAAGAALPSCALTSHAGAMGSHILTVEGAPGTRGDLTWGPLGTTSSEGYWPTSQGRELKADLTIATDGSYFVTAPALPLSMDAEPLGCALDQVDEKGEFVRRVAIDAPFVSWTTPFERRFNDAATSTSVWVQIEKPGLYDIRGDAARKASCEVYKVDGWKRERVGEGSDGTCAQRRALGAGLHEIRFYGGRAGVQTLRIAQLGLGSIKAVTPAKSSCTFEGLALTRGHYRLATSSAGGAQLRALFARPMGDSLFVALPVALDPGRPMTLALGAGTQVVARTRPGLKVSCALDGVALPSIEGVCQSGALAANSKLTLTNQGQAPAMLVVGRMAPALAAPAVAFDPPALRLPSISAAAPQWFDFDRQQQRSLLVTVAKPGLYDLASEGLLATSCRLRTPTIGNLAQGDQNGRGRNCLVQAYLKPGTYLFTVQTQGQSTGRAGVRLLQRPPRDLGVVPVGDDVFFRVPAGELAQQTIEVKKTATLALSTSAQGASLSCRLDDHDGWPLLALPATCDQQIELKEGRYLLSALPLTVDSRRRTSVTPNVDEAVLRGDVTHALALHRRYQAQLGSDGKDAFSFTLGAAMDVGIELDGGMQGRIVRINGASREVIDTVPPTGGSGMAVASADAPHEVDADEESGSEEDSEGEGESEEEYGEYEGGDEGDDGDESDEGEDQARARAAADMDRATAPQEVEALRGKVVTLAAGSYVLETEHALGDVAIRYGVKVGVRALAPGVVMTVPVPGRVAVVMPKTVEARAGLLRIKTRGEVDVRCRLRSLDGTLIAESADSGADWNCALAVPMGAGTYTLSLEAESLQVGVSEVSAAFLEAKDTGDLKDGDTFTVVAKVASAPIPAADANIVHDVALTSAQEFSCAVQDAAGTLLDRQVAVRQCRFLLWPGDDKKAFRVFVWTADRKASVKVALTRRSVVGFSGGDLDSDKVGRARIDVRGRFATGKGAMCRQVDGVGGVLMPCDGTASFVPGEVLVAMPSKGRIEMKEQIAAVAVRIEEKRTLHAVRAAARQRSQGKALHLVEVIAPLGSDSSPSCALLGGLATQSATVCAAATGPIDESTLTAWTRGSGASGSLDVVIARRAAVWPPTVEVLAPGKTGLSWADESARYALPADGFRVQLAMPATGWALLVDGAGTVTDMCAPRRITGPAEARALSTCVLRGRGGELVLVSPARSVSQSVERTARADLLLLPTPDAPRTLTALRETKPLTPGRERVIVARAESSRVLVVEGWGVLACAIHRDDGVHTAGCSTTLPAGQGAELLVEHDDRPWRVFTHAPDQLAAGRFGSLPPSRPRAAFAVGAAVPLSGAVVDQRLELAQPSAVRVRSTSGVCAIVVDGRVVEARGLGSGCDITRVLPAGSHRVVVRPFGTGAFASGHVSVASEAVLGLEEGVNAEAIVQGGDARSYRFVVAGDGAIGVGLQSDADTLSCTLLSEQQTLVGEGCHQFVTLARGTYYLRVAAAADAAPRRFRPVLFGLKGSVIDVPEPWLKDFFARAVPAPVRRNQ